LYNSLESTVHALQNNGTKVSMFIDPESYQVEASARIGSEMIELHTGCFANAFGDERVAETKRLKKAAVLGHGLGLQVNAGHGINVQNLPDLLTVPYLAELNIGHTLIARSVRVGLTTAVREMRTAMGIG
jgi:pyridoxine 5-phosphate synthase